MWWQDSRGWKTVAVLLRAHVAVCLDMQLVGDEGCLWQSSVIPVPLVLARIVTAQHAAAAALQAAGAAVPARGGAAALVCGTHQATPYASREIPTWPPNDWAAAARSMGAAR